MLKNYLKDRLIFYLLAVASLQKSDSCGFKRHSGGWLLFAVCVVKMANPVLQYEVNNPTTSV